MQLCVVVSVPCFDCLLPVPRPFCAHCNYTLFTGATELTSYPKVVVANFFLATFTCNPWTLKIYSRNCLMNLLMIPRT